MLNSSSSQDNYLLLIRRKLIYYFATIVLSLQHHLGTIIMYHLLFVQENKVKTKCNLVTSQKCKENKKRSTCYVHRFWKQDLSANNFLPNFADD